jgi:heme/copper-type cytochrome/quinol oxidase subunit 2
MQMVGFSGASAASLLEAARDAGKYKRALIVTSVTAAVLVVIVVIVIIILYAKMFSGATGLQGSQG